ncbi:MAG: hypothetical protein ACFFF4_00900 [Candidatus Thorarchaeota archaeon]
MNGKKIGVLTLLIIILIAGSLVVGQLPMHKTNVLHTDSLGDVSDPNIDIVEIKSYQDGSYIILEMVVAGEIQTGENYLYRLIITARGIMNHAVHIYSCTYQNGTLTSYTFTTGYNNSTLRIYFPLSTFASDSYMIGLEGIAQSPLEQDNTGEDREGEVTRLLFQIW